jgi:hypothetical protein
MPIRLLTGAMATGSFNLTPDLLAFDPFFHTGPGGFGGTALFHRNQADFHQFYKSTRNLFTVPVLGTVFVRGKDQCSILRQSGRDPTCK